MANYKMQKFLKSQTSPELSTGLQPDPNEPLPEEAAAVGKTALASHGLFERISGVLPPRLREAAMAQISKRGGQHGHTMSLGLPQSGGPFAPAVLSALGLRPGSDKAASDAGDEEPALGPRPAISRGRSAGDAIDAPPAEGAEETKATPTWKTLGMGFGYDIAEEDEEAAEAADAADQDENDDLRTNPSEDADTSDQDDDNELDPVADASMEADDVDGTMQVRMALQQQSKHNASLSAFGSLAPDQQASSGSDYTEEDFEEQYSNPSDEEAARIRRASKRDKTRRKRALTGGTLPSSSIGEADLGQTPRPKSFTDQQDQQERQLLKQQHDEVISNPSDEKELDYGTFGESDEEHQQRIRPANATLSSALQLNAAARPFTFGGAAAAGPPIDAKAAPAAAATGPAQQQQQQDAQHFRLPSIHHSSFGGSAFSENEKRLSATAPTFTPGSFTFQAPGGVKMPQLTAAPPQTAPLDGNSQETPREKRQRFVRGPLDHVEENDVVQSAPASNNAFDTALNPFMPTWGRANGAAAASLLSGNGFDGLPPKKALAHALPPFVSQPSSKPISIRRPEEGDAEDKLAPGSASYHKPSGRSALSSMFERSGATPPAPADTALPGGELVKAYHARNASINLSDVDMDEDPKNTTQEEEEELQDIIEELGQRLDRSLENWAGRILTQVQDIKPSPLVAAPAPPPQLQQETQTASLASADREALLHDFDNKMSDSLNTFVSQVKELIAESRTAEPVAAPAVEEPSNKTARGHGPLDAQGELDFDYVSDVLDAKISGLQKEVENTSQACFTKQQEVANEVPGTPRDRSVPATPTMTKAPEMSAEAIGRLADTLGFRVKGAMESLQGILLGAIHEPPSEVLRAVQGSSEMLRAELSELTPTRYAVEELAKTVPARFDEFDRVLTEAKTSIADQVEMSLVNAIMPHLESLRQEALDADVLAARITSSLIPLLDSARHESPEQLAHAIAETLQPQIRAAQTTLGDTEGGVGGGSTLADLQKLIEDGLREHALNLDPVIALMEPLLSKQEDAKSMARQVLSKQSEMENTLSVLPSAINAKTEIFLSAAQQSQEVQRSILDRLEQLGARSEEDQARLLEMEEERDAARREVADGKAELIEARSELKANNSYVATLKDEVDRFESRLEESQRTATDQADQMADLRSRNRDAAEEQHEAERRRDEAVQRASSLEGQLAHAQSAHSGLQQRLDQAVEQLKFDREERQKEREATQKAMAELQARITWSEQVAEEAQRRADDFARQIQDNERLAKVEIAATAERAGQAEGEVAALEKRIADQDSKIANLQQLSATQKQKAAQNQQKLAEGERKAADLESVTQQLAIAQARMADMESRLVDQQDLTERLRGSQEAEMVRCDLDAQTRLKEAGADFSFFLIGRNYARRFPSHNQPSWSLSERLST